MDERSDFVQNEDIYAADSDLDSLKLEWDSLCNGRVWIGMIGFSLLFMPLFAKTYRLSIVFKTLLQKKSVQDIKLFAVVFVSVLIDIVLLTVINIIQPLKRVYLNGELDQIDELRKIQYIFGQCRIESDVDNYLHPALYIFLYVFKAFELICVLYVAFDVSRINDVTNMLTQFDETGIQLLSISLSVIVLCITVPILLFGPTQNPSFYASIITIAIFLIGNIVVLLNLCPRICAVIRKKEQDYMLSPMEKLEKRIKSKLKFSWDHENGSVSAISMPVQKPLKSPSGRTRVQNTPTTDSVDELPATIKTE